MTRRPEALQGRLNVTAEVVQGDVFDCQSLQTAFEGVTTAYYFVHSMGDNRDFESQDRIAAENFAKAATRGGVQRLVYLGGLGNPNEKLSKHLRSRQETGDVLRAHHSNVIEFRASIVIGSGSLSFEMIRALVERLPIMICPRWVQVQAQPLAIEDLLAYLLAALQLPTSASQVYEIGGPDQVSYGQIMQEYARQRGLTRWMIPVPLLTPYLSSLWLGLVTPLYARVGRKLVESLRNPTLVSNNLAQSVFAVRPRFVRDAIARALVNEDREFAETRWSDALSSAGKSQSWGGDRFGSRLVDSRTITVAVAPEQAFAPIRRIGGQTGWWAAGICILTCGAILIARPHAVRMRHTEELIAGETNMSTLEVGDHAPDFSATTSDGQKICLADFLGKRALALFFYPKDGSTICTQQACAFRDSYEQFLDAGADVIGISSDTDESHRAFARQNKLSFPLISDSDGSLRNAFAVPKTMGLFPGRVTYVIDSEGIVRHIFSAQFASDEHIRQALIAVAAASKPNQ